MTIRYLDPEEREAEKYLDEILKYIDPISVVNTTVVLLASLQFGAGWWKAILISLAIWVMTRMHYGRRLLTKVSIVLLLATLVSWSNTLPNMDWIMSSAKSCLRT